MNSTEKMLLAVVVGVVGVVVIIGSVFFISNMLVDKVTNKVIDKLQKDYSPSPYGPGFDPDKVPPPKGPLKSGWEPGWETGRK